MTTFHLTVVTPDGCAFDGQAERIVCRAIDGDIAILARHGDYCTALGMGEAHIVDADGQRRRADPAPAGEHPEGLVQQHLDAEIDDQAADDLVDQQSGQALGGADHVP